MGAGLAGAGRAATQTGQQIRKVGFRKMNKMKRGAAALLVGLMVLCALTACSLNQNDSKTTDNGVVNNGNANKGKTDGDFHEELDEPQAQDLDVSQGEYAIIGDEIKVSEGQNGVLITNALVYKVTKAQMFDSPADAGIAPDKLAPYIETAGDTDFYDTNGNFTTQIKFLLVEMTAQNIKANMEQLISVGLSCADKTSDGFFELPPTSYFSHATLGVKDYLHYQLPVGEIKNLKLGFFVNTQKWDVSDLYLAIPSDDNGEYQLILVKLGL
jgi:hypothetical protein